MATIITNSGYAWLANRVCGKDNHALVMYAVYDNTDSDLDAGIINGWNGIIPSNVGYITSESVSASVKDDTTAVFSALFDETSKGINLELSTDARIKAIILGYKDNGGFVPVAIGTMNAVRWIAATALVLSCPMQIGVGA